MGEGWKCTACGTKAVLQRNPDGSIWYDDTGEARFRCPKCTDVEDAEMPSDKPLELKIDINTPEIIALIKHCVSSEREACCRDVCYRCSKDIEVSRNPIGAHLWYHPTMRSWVQCSAAAIRERAYRQAEG